MEGRIRLPIVVLLVVMVFLLLVTGCATGGASTTKSTTTGGQSSQSDTPGPGSTGKVVEIRHSNTYTAGSPAHELFNRIVDEFNNANANIEVVNDALATADLRTKLTVEYAAGTPAELSWCPLSYAREFAKDDKVINWSPLFEDTAHPEFKQWFEEKSLYFAQDEKGRVIMAPTEASIDGLFYNKELFEKYGWTPPETFDDLIDLAGKCREQGIYAMVTGGKDGRFAWQASALLSRAAGMDNANALALGDAITKWDDPQYGFVATMEKFKAMVDAEAYPPGLLGISASEADQMFVREEAAMYYEGQWKPGNWISAGGEEFIAKVGRVNFPVMTDRSEGATDVVVGGNLVGLIIPNGLDNEHFEATVKWAKVVLGPDFNTPLMESGSNVWAGKADYDTSKVPECFNLCVQAYRNASGYIPSMDTFAPPAIDLAIKQTAMPGIVSGEYSVEQAVAEVQKAAMDYVNSTQ